MAKKIKEIHDQVNLLTAKGRTGYHTPKEIDIAVYMASKILYNEMYRFYEETDEISDSMSVFLSNPTLLTLTSGDAQVPDDFVHEVGYISANGKQVKRVTHAQLAKKLQSALTPVTVDYPVCVFYSTFIRFYPTTLTNVYMTYLKKPVEPLYAFTVSSGRPVYDDDNSIDVEWGQDDITKLTNKTLEILAQNLSDPALLQYAKEKDIKER
jgi:hypothetical protein